MKLARSFVFLLSLMLLGTGNAAAGIFTIGMLRYPSIHDQTLSGFKVGMAAHGYIEGRDVRYIYCSIEAGTSEEIDACIGQVTAQGVDLFFTAGNIVSYRVKLAVEKAGTPVLFAAATRPVTDGLVESLSSPGGNLTGVQISNTPPKALELLRQVSPRIRKVLLPYNPGDSVSLLNMEGLDEKASRLGLELIRCKVSSVEEAVSAIENRSDGIGAILRIPSPTLDPRSSDLNRAAARCALPVISTLPLGGEETITFATDTFAAGEQTARLAHLILKGAKPWELPVETCDAELTVNLKTAEAIGFHIPDEVLIQAKTIIR